MSALFLQGNARDVLKGLPADYFHCCVTSGIDTSEKYIQLAEVRIAEDEQKRIDEQIKQPRKEAKLASKNG